MLRTINSEVFSDYAACLRKLVPGARNVLFYDREGELVWEQEQDTLHVFNEVYQNAIRQAAQFGELPYDQRRISLGECSAFLFHLATDGGIAVGSLTMVVSASFASMPWEICATQLAPAIRSLCREIGLRSSLLDADEKLEAQIADYEFLSQLEEYSRGNGRCDDALREILNLCQSGLNLNGAVFYAPEHKLRLVCGPKPVSPLETELLFESLQDIVSDESTNIAEALANRPRPNVREPIAIWPVLENASRLVGILVLSRSDKILQWSRHTDSLVRLVISGLERILEREYDSLTGLVNWSGFESVLSSTRDSADIEDCILMFMDVDKLHVVNDTFGRDIGDAVLCSVADLLRSSLDGHVIARITDDSFGVLLKGLNIGDAETAGQNICQLVRETNYKRGSELFRPSISIGLAELDDATKSATDWLAHAQVACQAAKDRGCGRVEIYQSSDASIIRRMDDISMIGSIRNAVDSGRLVLYAQPIVPLLQASAEQHFELLVRLLDASGRAVEPAEFIRTAERYQLIQDIDRWVVTKALESLQRQRQLHGKQNLRFAINLSGQSLGDDQFLQFIRAEIARLNISPAWLCFEITETVAMSNLSKAQVFINELKHMGCRFSLDDFGTGLSSFAYLKLFRVDKLKIDGSFVHDICDNDVSRGMVEAVVQLARVMQIETVAEYVQDKSTLKLLRQIGVDWAQGFYVGEPMRLSKVLKDSNQPDYTDTTTLDTVRLATLPV